MWVASAALLHTLSIATVGLPEGKPPNVAVCTFRGNSGARNGVNGTTVVFGQDNDPLLRAAASMSDPLNRGDETDVLSCCRCALVLTCALAVSVQVEEIDASDVP